METCRISVLVSGNGSNLQCIIDAVEDGRIANSKIVGVISSSENAYALERARQHEIPAAAVTKYEYADMRDRMDAILKILDGEGHGTYVIHEEKIGRIIRAFIRETGCAEEKHAESGR